MEKLYIFLRGVKGLSKSTVKRYSEIATYIEKNKLDPFEFYLNTLDSEYSNSHKRNVYYAVKYICEYQGVNFPFTPPKQHQKRRDHAKEKDIIKLLSVVKDPRDKALLLLHIYTGLRPSELLKIKISDIDFKELLVNIRETKTFQDRIVPFNVSCKLAIMNYLDCRMDDNCPYLFKCKNEDHPMTLQRYRYILREYCDKANLKRITPYMIRHTFATCYIESGGNLKALKEILGHRQIKTTEIYIHESESIIKKDYSRTSAHLFS
jgi:integrase/recombinase XerD